MNKRFKSQVLLFWGIAMTLAVTNSARGARYEVMTMSGMVAPGAAVPMFVHVITEPNDNVVGYGYYAFAVNLSLSGSLPVPGTAVGNVVINTSVFNNLGAFSPGHPIANGYVDTFGTTTDVVAPNPGANVDDVVRLFDFTLTIPPAAMPGDIITITPSQGTNQNVTVNPNFDVVFPQNYQAKTLIVVPEPAGLILLAVALMRRRRRVRASKS